MEVEDLIRSAAGHISTATALIYTSGAGMSVDSGLATFRGRHQQDKGWGPIERDEKSPYSMSKPIMYDRFPRLTWGYDISRYNEFFAHEPHDGYKWMLEWAKEKKSGFGIYTSNIDCYWPRALKCDPAYENNMGGFVEYHGSMAYMQCHRNCRPKNTPMPTSVVKMASYSVDAYSGESDRDPPHCVHCGQSQLRFNVFLVGDNDFNEYFRQKQLDRWEQYIDTLTHTTNHKVVIIEIGAGTSIPSVRRVSGALTKCIPNSILIRINLDEPELDRQVDIGHIRLDDRHISIGGMGALEVLEKINRLIQK